MKGTVLASLVLVAATSGSVTLHDSNVTFRQALHSCTGALGSVSFALAHARTAAAEGVDTDESAPDSNGMMTVMFTSADGSKSAKVSIDQGKRSINAKNLRVEMNRSVACVLPD